MRKLARAILSQGALDRLSTLTQEVIGAADPRARAKARWRTKPKGVFEEIRSSLIEMASGRSRCMYCEDSLGTDIDHFRPKAQYPDQTFRWENYLLACSHCNSNQKREEFPLDSAGLPLLIDPSQDDPGVHLAFLPTSGEFAAQSLKGQESIRVFGLNDETSPRRLPSGRKQALTSLMALLKYYDDEVEVNPDGAEEIKTAIRDYPFSAVLHWLVGIVDLPVASTVLGAEVVNLIRKHQVGSWL